MSFATITFTIGGQPVVAPEAAWYQIAPCGCASGVTVAQGVYGSPPKLTEDDAWGSFYSHPGAAEHMKRDRAAGFRMEIGLRDDVKTRLTGECPHVPKWGVTPPPTPGGYTWAGMRDSRRSHLVVGTNDRDASYVLGDNAWNTRSSVAPLVTLCGKSSRFWSTHWASNADAPTCRKCERAALNLGSVQ